MSDKVKGFGAGAIIMGMVMIILGGVLSWVGLNASEVPQLKVEIKHLNKNISGLTTTIKENTNTYGTTLNELKENLMLTQYKVELNTEKINEYHRYDAK